MTDVATDTPAAPSRAGLRWWKEVLFGLAVYAVYSAVRNRFGSAGGDREVRKRFLVASLARTRSERKPLACVGNRFRLLRSFGINRSAAPARGSAGPDG